MMNLTGLHILLSYTCNYQCDHCFVWGSPWQTGTFNLSHLTEVFRQAVEVGTIEQIYFEGGEAFLYYPVLVEAISQAKRHGFSVGVVSNGYWATSPEDAWVWLQPLAAAGLDRLEISCDLFHGENLEPNGEHPGLIAAGELFLDTGVITVDPPTRIREATESEPGSTLVGGGVMFRGRAAEKLTEGLPRQSWTAFTSCPYEDLAEPGRIHLDPFGNLHLCQGLVIGNLFERPLAEIIAAYDPQHHPLVGPLLNGGPAQLARHFELDHEPDYVDACHLCYSARLELRPQFPAELGPDQMYGEG
jgi:MoaA/NifB/PqqE/SkfB family radical SAM enzyme